jgi:hypothetical protein
MVAKSLLELKTFKSIVHLERTFFLFLFKILEVEQLWVIRNPRIINDVKTYSDCGIIVSNF